MKVIRFSAVLLFILFIMMEIYFFYVFSQKVAVPQSSVIAIDSVIVLAGGKGRIQKGVELFLSLSAQYCVLAGVDKKFNRVAYFSKYGISDNPHIYIDNRSRRTLENAVESWRILEPLNVRSVLLVTSNYHMYRSLFVFKKVFPSTVSIFPYSLHSDNFDVHRWYTQVLSSLIIFQEFLKYQWYQFLLS